MRPSEALALHRDEVLAILSRYPVRNPRVFGSVARGEDTEDSDLDILVEHDGMVSTFDLAQIEIEIERAIGSRVEVKIPGDLSTGVASQIEPQLRSI